MITVLNLAGSGGWAGGETYLLLLARYLDRERFRLIVASPEPGALVDNLRAEGIEAHVLDMEPLGSLAPLFRLRNFLREQQPDIVQSHGARGNVYSRIAGRLAETGAIVSTVHNSLYDYPIGRIKKWLYLACDKLTAPLADCTLCVAESHRQELINRYGLRPDRVVTIPNGVDLTKFQPTQRTQHLREALAISDDVPVIGIVGRLTDQKGHVYLLRALPLLLTKFPALRCLVVGDGELREELQKLAVDLGLTEHCLFLGVRQDIPEVLAAMDLLVLPSLSEGMPYAALEGMAMGKPVVATAVNGVPELIQDGVTGLLVPRKDPVALAQAIETVLANPHLAASFGLAARRLVEQTYSIEAWVGQMESLYESLVDHAQCSCTHD
ncbi:MAG: glycosyltransferase [Nitrospirae bacterium]|nr:glycosyltransferase [Nitrospirota bacterium]